MSHPIEADGSVGQPMARLGRITPIRIHRAGAPAGGRAGAARIERRRGESMDVSHGDCRPRWWTGVVWVAALAALLLLAPLNPAAQAHARLAATPSGHITVIVLDMSGSMQSNDAQGLRCSAANAYVDLSGPGDFVGVVGLKASGATAGPPTFPAPRDRGLTPPRGPPATPP